MEDDLDAGAAPAADDRPRGVSKARLSDLDVVPKLSIFYRRHRNAPMFPLYAMFSKEAAKLFCDRIRSEVENNNSHSFVITGGDQKAYKQIFDWVNDCVQSQSIEKFPDIPEPEQDPFTPTYNVIIAGQILGVPAGSLSFHLFKRLNGCARKHLMPFSQVREFYDATSKTYNPDLKDIACSSIFNAWWDARLDESVNPELMEELSDLRDEIEELDADLHKACVAREEEVRKKWAEKRAKKDAELTGNSGFENTGANDNDHLGSTDAGSWNGNTTISSSWNNTGDEQTQATTPINNDWENNSVKAAGDDPFAAWSKSENTASHDAKNAEFEEPGVQDWADEMNEPFHEPPATAPLPRW